MRLTSLLAFCTSDEGEPQSPPGYTYKITHTAAINVLFHATEITDPLGQDG